MSDRIPTLADLCSAIADGRIPANLEGSMYAVNALELRRYLNTFRSLPTISLTRPTALSSLADANSWSTSTQTTIF